MRILFGSAPGRLFQDAVLHHLIFQFGSLGDLHGKEGTGYAFFFYSCPTSLTVLSQQSLNFHIQIFWHFLLSLGQELDPQSQMIVAS